MNVRSGLEAAEIGHRAPTDLRDTYASWLLSLGVQLGYVGRALGHSDAAITAEHYATWCGRDSYCEPMALAPGARTSVRSKVSAKRVELSPSSSASSPRA